LPQRVCNFGGPLHLEKKQALEIDVEPTDSKIQKAVHWRMIFESHNIFFMLFSVIKEPLTTEEL
jgi:hypothetical protein